MTEKPRTGDQKGNDHVGSRDFFDGWKVSVWELDDIIKYC